jgi:hypothetical protein
MHISLNTYKCIHMSAQAERVSGVSQTFIVKDYHLEMWIHVFLDINQHVLSAPAKRNLVVSYIYIYIYINNRK